MGNFTWGSIGKSYTEYEVLNKNHTLIKVLPTHLLLYSQFIAYETKCVIA